MTKKDGRDTDGSVARNMRELYLKGKAAMEKQQDDDRKEALAQAWGLLDSAYEILLADIRKHASEGVSCTYRTNFSPVCKDGFSILVQANLLRLISHKLSQDGFQVTIDLVSLDLDINWD